jgi:hypothetical protein
MFPNKRLQPIDLFPIEDNPADVVAIWHILAESGTKVKVHLASSLNQSDDGEVWAEA